jgi:catechol 2,3-dioxygenase-like lactoylglutathione lyase family enzyme
VAARPSVTLSGTVLEAPDAGELAAFYQRLLGWEAVEDGPTWVTLRPPGGGTDLSFQTGQGYVPPVWPPRPGEQQMMAHLDLRVDDLEEASAHARACGAPLADHQPQDDVRVHLDPAGHPFCLFVDGA